MNTNRSLLRPYGHLLLACFKTLLVLFLASRALAAQQPTLQITSPANGAIIALGQNLAVSVISPSGSSFSQVDVIGDKPLGMTNIASAVPAQFSISIPSDIPTGRYTLTAEGTTTSGQNADSVSVMIDLERPDNPSSLSAQVSMILFRSVGNSTPLIILATFADGSVVDVTGSSHLSYSSSNANVATVDTNGIVTALGYGSGTITATYTVGGATLAIPIPVTVPPAVEPTIQSTTVAPVNPSIAAGVTQQFTASGQFSDGSTHDVTNMCAWTSSAASTATISATGLATALNVGTTTISATSANVTSSTVLTVTPASACATDFTSQIVITGPYFTWISSTQHFVLRITLTNSGSNSINGPISLVFDNLSSNATLFNPDGTTSCAAPAGSPYVTIAGPLNPGASYIAAVQFFDPTRTHFSYTIRVLAGSGNR
jgi:hypothetical protein